MATKKRTRTRYQDSRRVWLERLESNPLIGPDVLTTARRMSTGSVESVNADHVAFLVTLGYLRETRSARGTVSYEIFLP